MIRWSTTDLSEHAADVVVFDKHHTDLEFKIQIADGCSTYGGYCQTKMHCM